MAAIGFTPQMSADWYMIIPHLCLQALRLVPQVMPSGDTTVRIRVVPVSPAEPNVCDALPMWLRRRLA